MKLRLSVVLAFAVLSGCASSTSSNGPVTIPATVHPGPGSWWVKVAQYHDSTGALTEADTSIMTVLDTGLSLYGKTSVLRLQFDGRINDMTSSQHYIDTQYRHYESNGDYSYYYPAGTQFPGQWFTWPFGSQSTLITLARGVEEGAVDSVELTFHAAGTGSFTLKGRTYVTANLRRTERTKDSVTNGTSWSDWTSSPFLETVQYSPELGNTVSDDEPAYRQYAGGPLTKTYHSELVDFQMK